MAPLQTKISSLGGVYKRFSSSLEKLGIVKLGDFLLHIPFRYDDFSQISEISKIQPGEVVTIRGKILDIKNQYTRRGFTLQKARAEDKTGIIDIVWFNQPYIPKSISKGDLVSFSGKAEYKGNKLQLTSPEYEIGEDSIHTGRLVPIYPETRGITSKWIRRQIYKILNENEKEIGEFLPDEILERNNLEDLLTSLKKVHFPDNLDEVSVAKQRLAFNELFLIQMASNTRKIEWQKYLNGHKFEVLKNKSATNKLIEKLSFRLTKAQEKALDEIFNDLSKKTPMNRLLEGDVGSGKTIVATISAYLAYLNGYQTVFMAPTEILAGQHYKTISELLTPLGLKVSLSTSSMKIKHHKSFDVLVGTHAVLGEKIKFEKLGLVVIDEQQRFGVEQRAIIRKKGKNPHVLTMTATPIPRTIALTLYGDLDLSVLDELPKGRKIIKTWHVPNFKRANANAWIKTQIDEKGSQVFIICPFIEESESMQSVKAATKEFENLKSNIFKKYRLAMLHGKLKSKQKDEILNDFKNKKFDILVATPVVEVGIDVPNADIILIETAERFGLSQLHQLRGRVGRNDRQAFCLLFTDSDNLNTTTRLKAMEKTNIGSELAELDLKIRGAGEIYGIRQSGRNFLKIASFSDFDLIRKTKKEAEFIMENVDKYPKLLEKIEETGVSDISPD